MLRQLNVNGVSGDKDLTDKFDKTCTLFLCFAEFWIISPSIFELPFISRSVLSFSIRFDVSLSTDCWTPASEQGVSCLGGDRITPLGVCPVQAPFYRKTNAHSVHFGSM